MSYISGKSDVSITKKAEGNREEAPVIIKQGGENYFFHTLHKQEIEATRDLATPICSIGFLER